MKGFVVNYSWSSTSKWAHSGASCRQCPTWSSCFGHGFQHPSVLWPELKPRYARSSFKVSMTSSAASQSTSYSSHCAASTLLLHSELGVWTSFNGLRSFLKSICESAGKQIQNVWARPTIRHKTDCNLLNFDLICVECVFFINYKTLNMILDTALELNTVTGWNWRDTQTFTRMSRSRQAVCLSDAAVASCQRRKTSHAATHRWSRQCFFHLNTFEAVSDYISEQSVFGGLLGQDIKTQGDHCGSFFQI